MKSGRQFMQTGNQVQEKLHSYRRTRNRNDNVYWSALIRIILMAAGIDLCRQEPAGKVDVYRIRSYLYRDYFKLVSGGMCQQSIFGFLTGSNDQFCRVHIPDNLRRVIGNLDD
ncbi:hypothetical protein KJ605_00195 [Patescibacteria group bacterium]|nr:hypothetical protein [Patescibacteria group bacterium]